jgi:hypothetical protein
MEQDLYNKTVSFLRHKPSFFYLSAYTDDDGCWNYYDLRICRKTEKELMTHSDGLPQHEIKVMSFYI